MRLTSKTLFVCILVGFTLCCSQPPNRSQSDPQRHAPKSVKVNEPIQPIPLKVPVDGEKVALGERLFHETMLSKDNTVACAGCHNLKLGGSDRRRFSFGLNQQMTRFNAPTVYNAAFNFTQFWNGRAPTLEAQIEETTHSLTEMGSTWEEIVEKLSASPGYTRQFQEVYPDGITPANIKDAIAEFERSLITPNSPFDRYLRGEQDAIASEALRGYQLFKSYGCVTCHQGIGVGGNIFATFGVMGNPYQDSGQERDMGRYNVTGKEADKYVFKVPSLRNVALTAPYFHDGSADTLEDAIRIMARYQLGRKLNDEDTKLIAAFLRTLTGEAGGEPLARATEMAGK